MRLLGRLRKYKTLAVISMQNTLAYRLSFVLNFVAGFVGLIAVFYLWNAIYSGRAELSGFTWEQMKTYLIVSFFLNSMLSYYSESGISWRVIDGSVAMDLLKPLNFQKARLAETLGSCILEGLLGSIFICAFAVITFDVPLPSDGLNAFLFVVSMLSSILVKFGIVYMTALLCFWTSSGIGVIWARMAITNLMSGALVPLAFFPGWLKSVAMCLPFQGIVNTPVTIFLGQVDSGQAILLILLQWFWIVALWYAGKWMWSGAVRQITIHGG